MSLEKLAVNEVRGWQLLCTCARGRLSLSDLDAALNGADETAGLGADVVINGPNCFGNGVVKRNSIF